MQEEMSKEVDIKNIYEKIWHLCTFPLRVSDSKGKIILVNDAYCKLIGVTRDNLIGKSFEFVYAKQERNDLLNYYLDFIKKGKTYEKSEKVLTLSTGERLNLEASYSLLEINGEKFILALFNDITEKKKSDDLLKESEETFRKLFEESNDSIFLLTLKGFYDCNNATLKVFNYSKKEDIIGKQPWEVSPPKQPDGMLSETKAKQMINKAMEEGFNRFEWVHRKSDGTDFPCEVLLFSIKIKNELYFYSIVRDITKRKKIESDLRDSENRYKAIFENTGSLTMIVDEDNTIVLANNETYPVTGYKPEEIIGTKWTNYVAPESLDMMMKYHKERRVNPEKVPKKYEARLINKKGEVRDTILSVCMIPGMKQSVVSIQDISDIKEAQKALEESENRFRRLAENAEDIIYRYEFIPERGFTYVSPAATKITGYTPEDHYADPDLGLKIVHPDDRNILQEYFNSGGVFGKSIILRWIKKDGTIIWTEQRNIPVYNEKGEVIAIEGIARDITDRKLAEEEIKKSEKKYRDLVNFSPDIIVIHSEGKLCYINPAGLRTFGLEKIEDAIGKPIIEFVAPEQREMVAKRIQKALREKSIAPPLDEKFIRLDGTEFYVNVSAIPIEWEGKPAMLVVATDITDRKLAEEELKKKYEELERYHNFTVDRELKMIELKKMINKLSIELGKEPPFNLSFLEDDLVK